MCSFVRLLHNKRIKKKVLEKFVENIPGQQYRVKELQKYQKESETRFLPVLGGNR